MIQIYEICLLKSSEITPDAKPEVLNIERKSPKIYRFQKITITM